MKFTFSAGESPLEGYTIKRAIHRGGFGEVYFARSQAGKDVAIKLLHDNSEVELRGVSQCLNLKHPHLVTIFDVKTDQDGDHWVVMEYVAGETLADRIRRAPQGLPLPEIRQIFEQICTALAFLHSRSLVHRDMKPANIFLEAGQVKIGDVGLSKFIGPSRRSAQTQSVGTVYYMAPELAKGNYGPGVDIYAVGVILYEMLTGQVPFDGESTGEILMKHLTQPPDLSIISEPGLRPVLKRALEKEESKRFRTVQEFQEAFAAAVAGKSTTHKQTHQTRANAPYGQAGGNPRGTTASGWESVFPGAAACAAWKEDWCSRYSARLPRGVNWWWLLLTMPLLPFLLFVGFSLLGALTILSPLLVGAYLLLRFCLANTLVFGQPIVAGHAGAFGSQPHAKPGPMPGVEIPPVSAAPTRPAAKETPRSQLGAIDASRGQWWSQLLAAWALTPLLASLIAVGIAFFSTDFFSSIWSPREADPVHVGFFIASTTLAAWLLLSALLTRRNRRGTRTLGWPVLMVLGILVGLGASQMGDWLQVHYPESVFPPNQTGIIHSVGRHELTTHKPTTPPQLWQLDPATSPAFPAIAVSQREQANQAEDFWWGASLPTTPAMTELTSPTGNPESSQGQSELTELPRQGSQVSPQLEPVAATSRAPSAFGYALFFGLLFAFRGWPKLISVRRKHRLEWWSLVLSAGYGALICLFVTFPVMWAATWAAAITATVQLVAPYESRRPT